MPGATETDFFERADMLDTKVGTMKKDDAGEVAKIGFEAMMNGEGDVVTGWQNKLKSAIVAITPSGWLAERHRKMAAPRKLRRATNHESVQQMTQQMTMETYKIVRNGNGWAVNHDGVLEGNYATKEAAFESAAAAASNAIKDGCGIAITVEPRASGETAVGGKP